MSRRCLLCSAVEALEKKGVQQGHPSRPPGTSHCFNKTQHQRECLGQEKADVLLHWVHANVAESLAESHMGERSHTQVIQPKLRTLCSQLPKPGSIQFLDDLDRNSDTVKWLPPGTSMAEMQDLAQTFLPDQKVSYSTFALRYHSKWEQCLKVRREGQHSKCNHCEKFKAYRRQVTHPTDVEQVIKEYGTHLQAVMADRTEDHRLNQLAQISVGTVPGTIKPTESLLSISLDAMDAAKFRIPRNLSAAKEFQNSWRPELTLVGAIVEGICEHYILADVDISKNANMQCSIIGLVLEETKTALQAQGKQMPCHLRLHTDNASGEGKNQTILYLAAWLVRRELFDSVTLSQFRVGHSHGKPDQRFSEVRFALAQCSLLEDPDHFANAIQQGVKPRESRVLKVHRLQATVDFKSFLEAMELKTEGHTQTKKNENNEEAVHVFNLSRYESLSCEIQSQVDKSNLPDSKDIILTCRLHLADSSPSQPPFVFAKDEDFAKLPQAYPTELNQRLQLSTKQKKEFEKTAWKISQAPWNMDMGSAYLLKLLQDNSDNHSVDWQPPAMKWMLAATPEDPSNKSQASTPALSSTTFAWNHPTPATVAVQRGHKRLRVKQPDLHRPVCTETAGAPASQFGRHGAPERVAVLDKKDAPATTEAETRSSGSAKAPKRKRPAAVVPKKRPAAAPSGNEALPAEEDGRKEEGRTESLGEVQPEAVENVPSLPSPPSVPVSMQEEVAPSLPSTPRSMHESVPEPSLPSLPSPPPSPPPPAGGPPPRPRAKATAKPKAKAKAKANAQAPVRRQLGRLPKPPGVELGCGACRYSTAAGCATCRARAGLILNEEQTQWVFADRS